MHNRQLDRPGVRPVTFDVIGWLADLGACPRDQIAYHAESEQGGYLRVTYSCGHERLATVHVARVTSLASPTWELVAEMGDRVERIVVPGGTRFVWR